MYEDRICDEGLMAYGWLEIVYFKGEDNSYTYVNSRVKGCHQNRHMGTVAWVLLLYAVSGLIDFVFLLRLWKFMERKRIRWVKETEK